MRTREDQTTEGRFGIHTSRHNRIKLQGGGQALLRGRRGSTISFAWEVGAKTQDANPCQTTREALPRDAKWLQTGESGRWVQQGNGARFSRWRPRNGAGLEGVAEDAKERTWGSSRRHTHAGQTIGVTRSKTYILRGCNVDRVYSAATRVGIRLIGAPPPTLPSTRRSPRFLTPRPRLLLWK